MFDLNAIEAAAKTDKEADQVSMFRPATVLEMVSMIRAKDDLLEAFRESERELMDQRDERDKVLRQALEAIEEGSGHIGLVLQDAIAAIKGVLEP